jgi:hypothetical protein
MKQTTMQSIKLRSHIGADGILHLELPVGITDTEIEVIVTVKAVNAVTEKRGWLPGFFEEVIGGWVGEPLERPEQGEFEIREQLF